MNFTDKQINLSERYKKNNTKKKTPMNLID